MTADLERFLREVERPASPLLEFIRAHFIGEVAPHPWQLEQLARAFDGGRFVMRPPQGRRGL